ncbi:MAG: FAD-dependent oxidoreductase [Chloroflexi bacterium AL-W]|nr:FAD-dependent oxidoreductase [Chloroflexi bacterium AL-N1]NOK66380.1 FAD-dependent oxidoreductase [Chloroflexi bacterium AL-N10]NOK71768.1 FAD-dependent oxidoreductase [Chloroflexi bacterium AL-N5]NOK81025.1 FAD-dependent oxidoreductase [Chloroflexi bacterium AL-W]NOK89298.1 FAD-dependent oxidoreductase [Chloroflexi bacterium AL-N15]
MHIILIGCGRVGAGLAHTLNLRGHTLVIIDKDASAFARLGASFQGHMLSGIGFDRDILLQAGIEHADGLAAITNSDEANVVIARLASQVFHVPRVVARLYDPAKAEIYRRLGVQTVSTTVWGINRITELLCYAQFAPVASLGDGTVDLVDVEVPHLLIGRMVHDVTLPGEIHIVAISRRGHTFLSSFGTEFHAGDLLHVAVLDSSAARFETLFTAT